MLRKLIVLSSLSVALPALAEIDLQSLQLESLCEKVRKVTYSRDERSADVLCAARAHANLLDYKAERTAKKLTAKEAEDKVGLAFRGMYINFDVIQGTDWKNPEYKSYSVDGKLIGYRGMVTAQNDRGLKAVFGAYFAVTAKGELGKVAKVFVLDRSKIVGNKVPADLVAPLAAFDQRVLPAERQGLWALTAEIVQLPGKDVEYGTADILLDLAKNLGGVGIYRLNFDSLSSVKKRKQNPARFVGAYDGKIEHGAFCENLLENGKPISEEEIEGDEAWKAFGTKCEKLTNDLIDAVSTATKASSWLLNSSFDEEERGYLLIPSREANFEDTFLKVYFDVSHNE